MANCAQLKEVHIEITITHHFTPIMLTTVSQSDHWGDGSSHTQPAECEMPPSLWRAPRPQRVTSGTRVIGAAVPLRRPWETPSVCLCRQFLLSFSDRDLFWCQISFVSSPWRSDSISNMDLKVREEWGQAGDPLWQGFLVPHHCFVLSIWIAIPPQVTFPKNSPSCFPLRSTPHLRWTVPFVDLPQCADQQLVLSPPRKSNSW